MGMLLYQKAGWGLYRKSQVNSAGSLGWSEVPATMVGCEDVSSPGHLLLRSGQFCTFLPGWFKQYEFVVSQFWRTEIHRQGAGLVVHLRAL